MNNKEIKELSELSHKEWNKIQSYFCKSDVRQINKKEYEKDLIDIKEILDREKITFWLVFGTLLGAVRENDFLDWDDNINIAVYEEDLLPKLETLKEKFISCGFVFRKMVKERGTKLNLYRHKHKSGIEGLFLNPLYYKNKYRFSNKFKHPRKYFEKYGIIKFKGEIFRVPTPVHEYLSFLYKDWKTPIKLKDLKDYQKWRNKKNYKW